MEPIKVAKSGRFSLANFHCRAAIHKRIAENLQYCNTDFKILNVMNISALCKILVRFGPANPDLRC